jgi:hypothetical protein
VKCRWKRGCFSSQATTLGGLVGAVVVADQVHVEVGRHLGVDLDQELLELHCSMAPVQGADHAVPSATLRAANRLVVP